MGFSPTSAAIALLAAPVVGILGVVAWGLMEYVCRRPAARARIFLPKGMVKRVAVVGAGTSGIACAKEALEAGMEVVVFEMTGEIGGNWVYRDRENHSSVYKTTFINTSRQIGSYSDFPMSSHLPVFPHHSHVHKYFCDYADHFGVTPHIRFHTRVVSVEQEGESAWRIKSRATDAGPTDPMHEEVFDAVMIANGHHAVPNWPEPFPGQDEFRGRIIHSHAYKHPSNPLPLVDKRALVLGIGNSGVDIACDLATAAEQVYLATRSGAWVVPKFIQARALDHVASLTRLESMLVPKRLRFAVGNLMMERLMRQHQGSMSRWGLRPPFRFLQAHPTISHDLLHRVGNGSVQLKPQLRRFLPDGVEFTDGTSVQVDAVIFATGYRIGFPFLSRDLLDVTQNRVRLYHRVFHPALPPTLAIIGLLQPLGSITACSEMQARWVVEVWKGNKGLPSRADMERVIQQQEQERTRRYIDRPRHTIQEDFDGYMDLIATELGVVPSVWRHPTLLRELLFCLITPSQYRLQGPGAKPELAATILRQVYREVREPQHDGAAAISAPQ